MYLGAVTICSRAEMELSTLHRILYFKLEEISGVKALQGRTGLVVTVQSLGGNVFGWTAGNDASLYTFLWGPWWLM
jgi:hypothetical protein